MAHCATIPSPNLWGYPFCFAAIILGIILGILLLILLALYKRISIAIQIIKEGSRWEKKNVWGIMLTRVTEQQLDVLSEGIVCFFSHFDCL